MELDRLEIFIFEFWENNRETEQGTKNSQNYRNVLACFS